jgi:hypothetical protein
MIQEIIVFIILAVVISYIAYTFFRKPVSKKSTACDGCSGCDLKKDLMCNLNEGETGRSGEREIKD